MTAPWREPAGWSRRDARRQEAEALADGSDTFRPDDELDRLDDPLRFDDPGRLPHLDRLDADPVEQDPPSAVYTYGDPGPTASADTPQDPDEARERHQTAIAVEAVHLLSQAQLIADNCVQEAEQYARDLVMVARTQYREILERAEEVAGAALSGLPTTTGDGPGPYVPVPDIEYVRTYAQVAKVQLRSVLDALTEQVDRLGTLPDLGAQSTGPGPLDPSPSDPPVISWDPEVDSAYR